jgi:hypothetical protein
MKAYNAMRSAQSGYTLSFPVIEEADGKNVAGLLQALCDCYILNTGLGIAASLSAPAR